MGCGWWRKEGGGKVWMVAKGKYWFSVPGINAGICMVMKGRPECGWWEKESYFSVDGGKGKLLYIVDGW